VSKGKIKQESIIGLLRESDGYLSGSEMAARMGVTRAAIWKTIGILKKEGYGIDSSPSKGYLLVKSPDLCISALKRIISSSSMKIGHKLFFFDSVASTNTIAMDLASQGCSEGTLVIADAQTAGKGRLGRSWVSPPGKNLYMSIVLRPRISPREATTLTLLSAVACVSAIRKTSNIPISIKWPNDLIVGQRKIGGILTEIRADIDRISQAVVGIGINVNIDKKDMPEEIREIATSLFAETNDSISRTELAAVVIREFDMWYRLLLAEGKKVILDEWRQMSSTIGRPVRVVTGDRTFEGVADGIDDEGLLIVKLADGSYRKISAGDVTMVRTKE